QAKLTERHGIARVERISGRIWGSRLGRQIILQVFDSWLELLEPLTRQGPQVARSRRRVAGRKTIDDRRRGRDRSGKVVLRLQAFRERQVNLVGAGPVRLEAQRFAKSRRGLRPAVGVAMRPPDQE